MSPLRVMPQREDRGASAGSERIQSDSGPAGEEAARTAREPAEYDRLVARQNEAAALMHRLQREVRAAERGSRHGKEVFARLQLAQEEYLTASDAVDACLRQAEESYREQAYRAVLHYTRDYGLEIFPVWWMERDGKSCACRQGSGCESKAKHPCDSGWPEVATSDPEQAARWWRPLQPGEEEIAYRPRANIGVKMGGRHFLLDVDTDNGKAGDLSMSTLVSHYGEDLPATLMYRTGGGGSQHVMLLPDGVEARNSASELGEDLDIRGYHGYGILPPSVSGKGPYVMLADRAPAVSVKWLADWLREQQRKRTERIRAAPLDGDPRQVPRDLSSRATAYVASALASAVQRVSEAPARERNNTLNTEAFNLFSRFGVAGFLDIGEVSAAMKDAAESCGLRGAEIPRTLQSAWEGAQEKPRSHELPDFVFEVEEAGKPGTDLVKPTLARAVYRFENAYDLRRVTTGEFVARPRDPDKPPLVTEIGEELGLDIKWWWRQAAEEWNGYLRNKKADERAREKAEREERYRREDEERLKAEQEEADRAANAKAAAELGIKPETAGPDGPMTGVSEEPAPPYIDVPDEDEDEDDEEEGEKGVSEKEKDKQVNPFPGPGYFSVILDHLSVSANQHERIDLHMRVADEPGRLVVDLCDAKGRVVLITADSWQVCDLREVPGEPWFRRGKHMTPQVVPAEPGDVLAVLKKAQAVIGMTDEQWAIALGGLIGGHFPSIDRPGWWLTGPSGAGKTTRGRMLANWLDPARHLGGRINLKRDERDARTKAVNRYIFTTDNISVVSPDESDFWCTLHTGASDEVRQLHTDSTMLSFEYKRIGLGTSVNLPTGFQPDALRRMLHIELEATDDHPDAGALWKTYEEIRPRVLGALYCVLAGVLKHLGDALAADLPGCPEMAAYARRLYAADLAYPGLGLYEAYCKHTGDLMVQKGMSDPLALLLAEAIDKLAETDRGIELLKDGKPLFDDTPTSLHNHLKGLAGIRILEGKWWPVDSPRLGHELTKLDAPLRRLGIVVKRDRANCARNYQIYKTGDAGQAPVTPEDIIGDAGFEASVT